MKKSIILVIAVLLVLVSVLAGCSSIKSDTVYNTQTIWDNTKNKEATDTITITKFSLAEIFIIEKAKFTLDRKFEDGNTNIDLTLDEFIAKPISKNAEPLLNIILKSLKSELNIDLTIEDINAILASVEELNINITLSSDNKKLDYNIHTKIGYKSPSYNVDKKGSEVINTDGAQGNIIKECINMLLSHFSSIFEPTKESAVFNTTNINKIIGSTLTAQDKSNIYKIMGVSYSELLSKKTVVNSSKNSCYISKNFIKKMDIDYNKIQFMYNKSQLIDVVIKAIPILSPENANLVSAVKPILNNVIKEITVGQSCIEIAKLNIKSTYKLNK